MTNLSVTNMKIIINSLSLNAYRLRNYCDLHGLISDDLMDMYYCSVCSYYRTCDWYLRLK